jgi:NTP pyrophosphatase (non-canonical NTP hydrolase)
MTFDAYQNGTEKTAIYPRSNELTAVVYTSLGLAGEAGEIANKVKKIIRDDNGKITDDRRDALVDEIGDCLWYLSELCSSLHVDLQSVAAGNLVKLQDRQRREKLTGSGDAR